MKMHTFHPLSALAMPLEICADWERSFFFFTCNQARRFPLSPTSDLGNH